MMIRAILIDDEPPARREMSRLLAAFEDVRVVGEADDIASARGLLLRSDADVVFLDIQLGRSSGFELLDGIDANTAVVFVTAYDAHAVSAFEASALDYLVKPVEPGRLASTIGRLNGWLEKRVRKDGQSATPLYAARDWIFIDSTASPEFIELAAISAVITDRGATRVWTKDGKCRVVDKTLEQWQKRLPGADFVKLSRSTLVNLRLVQRVEPWSNYSYRLYASGCPDPLIMSRRQATRLRDILG
jgi:two-component system, LytTR family, response regulator